MRAAKLVSYPEEIGELSEMLTNRLAERGVCYVGEYSALMVKDLQNWWKVYKIGESSSFMVKELHGIELLASSLFHLLSARAWKFNSSVDKGDKEKNYSTAKRGSIQYRKQNKLLPFTQHTHIMHPSHHNKVWYIKTNSGLFLFLFWQNLQTTYGERHWQ